MIFYILWFCYYASDIHEFRGSIEYKHQTVSDEFVIAINIWLLYLVFSTHLDQPFPIKSHIQTKVCLQSPEPADPLQQNAQITG